jgi:hypothetical protein
MDRVAIASTRARNKSAMALAPLNTLLESNCPFRPQTVAVGDERKNSPLPAGVVAAMVSRQLHYGLSTIKSANLAPCE